MTATSAQEAIAILIDLAQRGEINPWDVQVIEVIDRFLEDLGLLGNAPNLEADLPKSGQAFLWASMLVLLKAQTLEEEVEEEGEFDPILEEERPSLPVALESRLRRRTAAPPPRKRRVTLQELIEQIEQLATTITEEVPRRPPRPRPQSRREATRTITGLAHNENLTEVATQLEQFLRIKSSGLALTGVDLEQLLEWWTQATASDKPSETVTSNQDRVGVFWALLLLSAQSKVELEQAEFYQDLKITLLSGHSEEE